MLTGLPQSVVILLTGLVYYAVDFGFMRYYARDHSQGSGARSWAYTSLMVVFWASLVVQPLFLPCLGLRTGFRGGLLVQGAGLVLIACGLAIHWWARLHLGRFYVEDVRFQEGQYLVNTGPYSRVRHPVFTSFLLISVGLLCVNPALTTLAMVFYVVVDFSSAARKEEALLSEKLPEYSDYVKQTGRFFPKLGR